jgi:hypothetical protein
MEKIRERELKNKTRRCEGTKKNRTEQTDILKLLNTCHYISA